MKLGRKTLAVALGAALTLGIAGQASADVYGLGKLDITNLTINIDAFGGAGAYQFNTDANARLNGAVDPTDGSAECDGNFGAGTTNCAIGPPVLSGLVQNAPGGSVARGESDFQVFGQTGEYSNAEAAIITAQLVNLTPTSASSISESNLQTGTTASASTTVASNTSLSLEFEVDDGGSFQISFDAFINRLADVSGADSGLAQADTTLTVILTRAGQTVASWAPTGTNTVSSCQAGLTCTATETALALNGTSSSDSGPNQVTGNGSFDLLVEGLSSGTYTLALSTKTSTQLLRERQVPIPGTLLLLGTGLLLVGRASRRSK